MDNNEHSKASQNMAEDSKQSAIQSATRDERRFRPVFRKDGTRVAGVYVRQGVFYAYVRDPESGTRRWVRAPGQTVADAELVVRRSASLRDDTERAAFKDALAGARRRSEWSSLGKLLDAYPAAAVARCALAGRPRPNTVRSNMQILNQVFAGHRDAPCDRAPDLLESFLLARGEELAPPTRLSTLRRVQGLFTPWARRHYEREGLRVPDKIRWPLVAVPTYKYRAPPQELRRRTIEAGKAEIEKRSAIGAAFLLCYFGGMACADAERARWDWLGADGHLHFERRKTGKPCDPPLSRWALAQWRAWASEVSGEEVIASAGRAPWKLLHKAVANWMHGLGWEAGYGAHELRKLAASLWMTSCGLQFAARWIGDDQATAAKYYADCLPELAPTVPES